MIRHPLGDGGEAERGNDGEQPVGHGPADSGEKAIDPTDMQRPVDANKIDRSDRRRNDIADDKRTDEQFDIHFTPDAAPQITITSFSGGSAYSFSTRWARRVKAAFWLI